MTALHPSIRWMTMLAGDYVTPKGILELPWLLGTTPDAVPIWIQAGFAMVVFGVSAAAAFTIVSLHCATVRSERWFESWFFWLLAPFTVAYVLLIATRVAIFDRYLLPLVLMLLMLLLRLHAQRIGTRLPLLCAVLILFGAGYGVAGSHDMFAAARARLQAANTMRARGVPRDELRAGFEYDGWTEIEKHGFVNEPRIHVPAGVFRPWTPPAGISDGCIFWFQNYTPDIHARYELSNQPAICFPAADMKPVTYRTWLPPHDRAIYFLAVPQPMR